MDRECSDLQTGLYIILSLCPQIDWYSLYLSLVPLWHVTELIPVNLRGFVQFEMELKQLCSLV